MKKLLSVLTLSLLVSGACFASFPVKQSAQKTTTEATVAPKTVLDKKEIRKAERTEKLKARYNKKVTKLKNKLEKTSGDDPLIAKILAAVSVLFLPFGLHNWYLGRTKIALWQTLMVFPGFILLGIPALISWIWQIVDLIRLLINGELPSK